MPVAQLYKQIRAVSFGGWNKVEREEIISGSSDERWARQLTTARFHQVLWSKWICLTEQGASSLCFRALLVWSISNLASKLQHKSVDSSGRGKTKWMGGIWNQISASQCRFVYLVHVVSMWNGAGKFALAFHNQFRALSLPRFRLIYLTEWITNRQIKLHMGDFKAFVCKSLNLSYLVSSEMFFIIFAL